MVANPIVLTRAARVIPPAGGSIVPTTMLFPTDSEESTDTQPEPGVYMGRLDKENDDAIATETKGPGTA